MSKRPLEFESPDRSIAKQRKTEDSPLSPSCIKSTQQHATVTGLLASLSPIKPSRYFDGELTDGEGIIRLVGFDKAKQQELQSFCDYDIPVTLKNCVVQQNKFKQCLEVVLKAHTKIEPSDAKFNVPNIKTVGSSFLPLHQINQLNQHDRVTVKVHVVKVNDVLTTTGGKRKQEVIVADSTARATVTLWEADIGILKPQKSYQLNRLEVRFFQGKPQLTFPSVASVDEIDDIEDIVDEVTSDEDANEETLQGVTVSGIRQLEKIYTCVNCDKNVHPVDPHIGECSSCATIQKLMHEKQTAKLLLHDGSHMHTLRANDDVLRAIADTQSEVSAQDLLYAPAFNATFNQFNIITKISRY